MPDLNQFVIDAIKTESKIENVVVNEEFLNHTLSVLISAGNILDQIKKHVFYSKEYNMDDLMKHTALMNESVTNLNKISTNDIVDNETTLNVNPRIFHSIVGISTESTELLEALNISGKSMDTINIGEEFGDIDWYKAIGCNELKLDWDNILDTIILKLKKRYPDNFTTNDAINRNIDEERVVLNEMEINK